VQWQREPATLKTVNEGVPEDAKLVAITQVVKFRSIEAHTCLTVKVVVNY